MENVTLFVYFQAVEKDALLFFLNTSYLPLYIRLFLVKKRGQLY